MARNLCMEEKVPLTSASHRKTFEWIGGIKVEDDSKLAHYVMVFPLETDANREELAKPQPDPIGSWGKIFRQTSEHGGVDKPSEWDKSTCVTKKAFCDAVKQGLIVILTGDHCAFLCTSYKSLDGEEIILRILLARQDAQMMIAEHENLRVPLKREAYEKHNFTVPTESFHRGAFLAEEKEVVGHTVYTRGKDKIVNLEFREVDCLRMVRRRMAEFINVDALKSLGVALDVFPAHSREDLSQLWEMKWNDWRSIVQWPGCHHTDPVRDYFGEEVGFFFHWFNFFSRYLVVAGIVGFVAWGSIQVIDRTHPDDNGDDTLESKVLPLLYWPEGYFPSCYIRLLFTLFMCLWGSIYTKHYQRRANFKIMQWGMQNYANTAQVRVSYDPNYRGTMKDTLQHVFHWFLVALMITETFVVVWMVSKFREWLSDNADEEVIFGMTGTKVKQLFPNMIITANIKIVDQIWKRLSPVLTEKENWRTDQEMKDSKVKKMFIVKFIVYYYPFWFIAFLQETWHGIPPDLCLLELRQQIYIYFPTEIAFTIGMTILPLAMSWWGVAKTIKKATDGGQKTMMHTEMQTKCPEYTDDIEDTMELILAFGFLMMFSTVLSLMPMLALVSNLIQIRMMAFRLSYANKRPIPRGQEGFGAWADIVQFITFVGVLCNVGLAVFVMEPARSLPVANRMTWFLVAEHALIIFKMFITLAVPHLSDNQRFIEEYNSTTVPAIQWRCLREHGESTRPTDRVNAGKPLKVKLLFKDWQ